VLQQQGLSKRFVSLTYLAELPHFTQTLAQDGGFAV
jgi:hypothetical protein